MDIKLCKVTKDNIVDEVIQDVCDFFNYHRMLTNAPKEYWQTFEESRKTINEWIYNGEFRVVSMNKNIMGFVYYEYLNETFVRLEDIFLREEYRGKGIGKTVIDILDQQLKNEGVLSCSVNVIPRNKGALKFYIECGFDHLNMVEIRKNYDPSFDKNEEVEILGFTMKKY